MGSLDDLVSPLVAAVVTVEIDSQLHQLASEELIDCENVRLLAPMHCGTRTTSPARFSTRWPRNWRPTRSAV